MSTFSLAIASELTNSDNQFPVDFNRAWAWLGYSAKDKAKRSLLNAGFVIREGLSPTTYQHANFLNTRACMGAEPKIIKAERGGKTAREHATSEELSRLAVLQELQCCGLKKVDARGHSEISNVIQLAANDFQLMLEKFGVV